MVTGKLTQAFPRYRLYNSDSRRRAAGIWRLAGGGIVETDYYDYDTWHIGPYYFRCRYGYVVDFYVKKSTPPTYLLFQELLSTDTGIAAYFVNNTYICVVYPDSLKYINIEDKSYNTFQFDPGEIVVKPTMNVGLVKTYTMCGAVPCVPYRLQLDLTTYKLYLGNGVWADIPKGTFPAKVDEPEYAMYKRLLDTPNAQAVMLDSITGKEIFIGG